MQLGNISFFLPQYISMPAYIRKIKKTNCVVLAILMVIYFSNVMFSVFNDPLKKHADPNADWKQFAGSASCVGCHKAIYESHIKTAHYLDSRPASTAFIKGSFAAGKNKFVYNKWMEVVMEKKKKGYFQTAYIDGVESQSEPFDIVIGSGRKGQTYLYWNDDKLYQLPVSFYTPLNSWCNSPGFSINYIKFDRVIPAQCLECHGTYAEASENNEKQPVYDKSRIIYGVDCERCHGPAAAHVAFQKEHPQEKTARYITNATQLERQQRLDGCALCHSGFRNAVKPAFSFQVGDNLDDFSNARYNADSVSTLDVHGNQYGLLTASKCFKMSSQLDCSSCHNVHVNEVNSTKVFSQRCIACHADVKHTSFTLAPDKVSRLNENCVSCHMPLLPSRKIVLDVANAEKAVPDVVRTHRVAIYPDKTKEFLEQIQQSKN